MVGLAIVVTFMGLAVFAPVLAPTDPHSQNLRASLTPPGKAGYIMGSDELGRDTFSRVIYASRISLTIGLASMAFGLLLGVPMGLTAGFYGGRLDNLFMRLADILLAIPAILLALVVIATYGLEFWSLVVAVGFPDIPIFARLARASTLTAMKTDYVAAARATGASDQRIMVRHVLPNLTGPLSVQATFAVASTILMAGALSFFGLGIRPPTPEWGSMLAEARTYMRVAPHMTVFPGVALAILVLGVNLLGDAARQAFDPRFRGRDA